MAMVKAIAHTSFAPPPSESDPLPKLASHPGAASLALVMAMPFENLRNRMDWPAGIDESALTALRPTIEASLIPAKPKEIAAAVNLLLSFYRQRDAGADRLNDAQTKIWLHHLEVFPADILTAVVLAWTGAKNPFPPSVPGELSAIANPIYWARRSALWRLETVLAVPPAPEYGDRMVGPGRTDDVIAKLAGTFGRTTP